MTGATAAKSAALTAADRHAFAALELHDPLLRDWFEAWGGYGTAVDWIYERGMKTAAWSPREPIALTDVRHVHLVRLGCPPAIIHERERRKCISALRRAQQGECSALATLLTTAMVRSSALAGELRSAS
jgi:hypothetical protein